MEVRNLAESVLCEMQARGYAYTTLLESKKIFNSIARWFDEKKGGELTRTDTSQFLSEIASRLESGKIKDSY